ncbi:MAG: hypothetical protein ACRCTJ_02600 [Brevinema sp.]
MKEVVIITYKQGILQTIMPFFDLQKQITIIDETDKIEDVFQHTMHEIWIDGYIDLYDPRLQDPQYLHQFFIRLQNILNSIQKSRIKVLVRILRNFYYDTTHPELKKVFLLYRSLMNFIKQAYEVFEVMVPDILHSSYIHHPYHEIKNKSLLWNLHSSFQIIHQNDIVYNLLEHQPDKNHCVISGIRVGMGDICEKSFQIFGQKPQHFDDAYLITVQDIPPIISLDQNHYNLEMIFMNQLS